VHTIKPPETRLESLSRAGHLKRLGHELDGLLCSSDGQIWERVYLCCGQAVPSDPPAPELRPATLGDVPSAVALAIVQITTDIHSGRVPATVGAFGELHDYVDANEYGGLCDETSETCKQLLMPDTCAPAIFLSQSTAIAPRAA